MAMRIFLMMAVVAILQGCSFQTTLDKLISPERQDHFAMIAKRICKDPQSVRLIFAPEVRATFDKAVPELPNHCPEGVSTWQVTSYAWRTNIMNGAAQRIERVVIVGRSKSRWTTVDLRMHQRGSNSRLIEAYHIVASVDRPPTLVYIDQYDAEARFLRLAVPFGLIILMIIIAGLIWRQRREARLNHTDPE